MNETMLLRHLADDVPPVLSTFLFGQVNLVLTALVVLDCLAVTDRRWRGVLVGLAAAVKLTSVVTCAGFSATGFLLAPKDSLEYWFHPLLDPSRVGGLAHMSNQSLRGVLHRINPGQPGETLLWLPLSAIVALLAVLVARRSRSEVVALVAIALAGLLVSPVSWSHHRVWCVPAFPALGLVSRSGTRVALPALLVIFCVQPFAWLLHTGDREMHWAWWQHIPGDAYVGVGVATLVVLASTTWSHIRSRV